MVLDFAAIPPDITSALIYTGAGSGPLMAAAASWSNLAAELSTTASQWESIVTTLTTEQWTGLGSLGAATSAQPIVSWLTTAAAAAEHAATQATSSAAAYEAAFGGVIPPPAIAANRAQLAALVATNFLGINTPAIAATEAQYAEMWVQDAVTMYVYQAASAAAGILHPLAPEAESTNPAGPGLQAAATAQAATSTPAQGLLSGLTGSLGSGGLGGIESAVGATPAGGVVTELGSIVGTPIFENGIYNVGVTVAWWTGNMTSVFPTLGHLVATSPSGLTPFVSDVTPLGAGLGIGTSLVGSTNGAGFGGAATAALGEASSVGGLSVPAGWSAAAPATLASSTAPLEGSGWTVAADEAGPIAAMPGMPGMAAAAKGAGAYGVGPRYGFKPTVMPKVIV
jgi:PPE-repeat protein